MKSSMRNSTKSSTRSELEDSNIATGRLVDM